MNIPKDGGWSKSDDSRITAQLGPGSDSPILLKTFQGLWDRFPEHWLLLGSMALTGALCFGLGLLAAKENGPPKDPLWIEQLPPEELPGSIGTSTPVPPIWQGTANTQTESTPSPVSQTAAAAAAPQPENYVASKTGSKYYLPGCAGAKRIKEENKVWFATKELAAAAGYQPAANCKGL